MLEACFLGCPHCPLGARTTGNNGIACWKLEKEKPSGIVDNKLFSLFPGTSEGAIWFANEKIQKTRVFAFRMNPMSYSNEHSKAEREKARKREWGRRALNV